MKTLWIARHAESIHHFNDLERPLSTRGRKQAKEIGRQLANAQNEPMHVLCSNATRTQETLSLWWSEIRWTGTKEVQKHLYLADQKRLLQCICASPNNISNLCILAHNPGVSNLIQHTTQEDYHLEPGEIAQTNCQIQSWRELSEGFGDLIRIFRPNC